MSEEEQSNIMSIYWCCVFFGLSRFSIPGPWWVFQTKEISKCVDKSWPTTWKSSEFSHCYL